MAVNECVLKNHGSYDWLKNFILNISQPKNIQYKTDTVHSNPILASTDVRAPQKERHRKLLGIWNLVLSSWNISMFNWKCKNTSSFMVYTFRPMLTGVYILSNSTFKDSFDLCTPIDIKRRVILKARVVHNPSSVWPVTLTVLLENHSKNQCYPLRHPGKHAKKHQMRCDDSMNNGIFTSWIIGL